MDYQFYDSYVLIIVIISWVDNQGLFNANYKLNHPYPLFSKQRFTIYNRELYNMKFTSQDEHRWFCSDLCPSTRYPKENPAFHQFEFLLHNWHITRMNLVSWIHDSMDTGLEGVGLISKFPKV